MDHMSQEFRAPASELPGRPLCAFLKLQCVVMIRMFVVEEERKEIRTIASRGRGTRGRICETC
jgi:hypothetical protein